METRQRLMGIADVRTIAEVCHEANRAYCGSLGDESQTPWDHAPVWQKDSALDGVIFILLNPGVTPEDIHESWRLRKVAEGWTYGPEKDAIEKTHPFLVSFSELPIEQQNKDILFLSIVRALSGRVK